MWRAPVKRVADNGCKRYPDAVGVHDGARRDADETAVGFGERSMPPDRTQRPAFQQRDDLQVVHRKQLRGGLKLHVERRSDRKPAGRDHDAHLGVAGDVARLAARAHGVHVQSAVEVLEKHTSGVATTAR